LESFTAQDVEALSGLATLESLELGDCSSAPDDLFQSITALTNLKSLRLERPKDVNSAISELRWLGHLEALELVDAVLREGFGEGLGRVATLKRILLIPQYKDEVATVNAEMVDSVLSLNGLTHFYLGLTNEWLQSMSSLVGMSAGKSKDSFPIMVNGSCEMYSLSKLFKTLSAAMPNAKVVKILKMRAQATGKQFLETLVRKAQNE